MDFSSLNLLPKDHNCIKSQYLNRAAGKDWFNGSKWEALYDILKNFPIAGWCSLIKEKDISAIWGILAEVYSPANYLTQTNLFSSIRFL